MYIIELITKLLHSKHKNNELNEYYPFNDEEFFQANPDECNHIFLPLDSDEENFACKNCGIVVNKDELKNINIFKNKPFK